MQLFKDRIGGGSPFEGLAVRVVRGDEMVDALYKLLDADKRTPPNHLVSDQREEALWTAPCSWPNLCSAPWQIRTAA